MPDASQVILTGIPRSGTTLAASLIDSLPNTVCLNEPGWHTARSAKDAPGFAQFIAQDFTRLREHLLTLHPIPDRRREDGAAVTNYYRRADDGSMEHTYRVIPFTRAGLTPDFTLAIKHNGPYLAVLPELLALSAFTIIAIIRNPVEVIHSWRSLDMPISRAELPNAVPFWPDLADIVKSGRELLEKQVRIYDLMCKRLYQYREQIHLITYESLVQTPQLLGNALGSPHQINTNTVDKPSREVPKREREIIETALTSYGHHYTKFYFLS